MGARCYEVFQSPEKPYLADYFNILLECEDDQAMEIYWRLNPMRNISEEQFNKTVMTGTYNWYKQKFHESCVGGNGGLTRQPAMKGCLPNSCAAEVGNRILNGGNRCPRKNPTRLNSTMLKRLLRLQISTTPSRARSRFSTPIDCLFVSGRSD
jgi:hypothetical protein